METTAERGWRINSGDSILPRLVKLCGLAERLGGVSVEWRVLMYSVS